MQEQINELLFRFEQLEDIANFNQQNLILTWTILGVIVGALALSGFFFIKKWVNDRTDMQLEKFKNQIKSEVENYRVTTSLRTISLKGTQIISHSSNIHALIIKAYFEDETRTYNYRFTKDTLMYSGNGVSHDNIKLVGPNGAVVGVRVKRFVENGFELEWTNDGDIHDVTVGLDIMIF